MDEREIKIELRKIKLKQRQLSNKMKSFTNQNASIFDQPTFENQLKSMDEVCFELSDAIEEMIMDIEEMDGDMGSIISDLENRKENVLKLQCDSKQEFITKRNKNNLPKDKRQIKIDKKNRIEENNSNRLPKKNETGVDVLTFGQRSEDTQSMQNKIVERDKKKEAAHTVGETIIEITSNDPTEVVLELVLGHIGEQLGVKGTGGFLATVLTHYAISQFAVLIGLVSTPLSMDFSGIIQARILKKLEDLDKKVDKIIDSPRIEALSYLKEGLFELRQKNINFREANNKFKEVRAFAKKAISMDKDFENFAVCTKYLLFAETMVQTFTENYTEGEKTFGDCFLPVEKLTETRRTRMVGYLSNQVEELKSQMETKGKKKDNHREKIDDILRMIYNIISICKTLSNPNTLIDNVISFGIDIDFVPFGEETATILQVGRDTNGKDSSNARKFSEEDMQKLEAYIVYLWRDETNLFVRRKLKVFEIPLRQLHGNLVWVKLEGSPRELRCNYGPNNEELERSSSSRNGYPTNIQKTETLLEQVRTVKDMDSLPKKVFKQMQSISEVYLADLGIDVNEKDNKGRTLLHYVGCLKPDWTGKFNAINCLVDAGAKLTSQDNEGKTPLMAVLQQGPPLEKNMKILIRLSEGTSALNTQDNDGNTLLHLAASMGESKYTKDTIKRLLKRKADAKCLNKEEFSPTECAHHHQNWAVKKIFEDWFTSK